MSDDITFCQNPRCQIADSCYRNIKRVFKKNLQHISIASFGPSNGDPVTKPEDCEQHWPLEEENKNDKS